MSLIHEAIENGNTENIDKLIATEDINAKDLSGHTPLMIAARKGNVEWVKALIAAKADLELQSHSDYKWTALIIAASEGNTECLKALLNAKANTECIGSHGRNALLLAAHNGQLECLLQLINVKVNLNQQDKIIGNTALMNAAKMGHVACVKALLEAGARTDLKNDDLHTALEIAKNNHHSSCAEAIETFLKK